MCCELEVKKGGMEQVEQRISDLVSRLVSERKKIEDAGAELYSKEVYEEEKKRREEEAEIGVHNEIARGDGDLEEVILRLISLGDVGSLVKTLGLIRNYTADRYARHAIVQRQLYCYHKISEFARQSEEQSLLSCMLKANELLPRAGDSIPKIVHYVMFQMKRAKRTMSASNLNLGLYQNENNMLACVAWCIPDGSTYPTLGCSFNKRKFSSVMSLLPCDLMLLRQFRIDKVSLFNQERWQRRDTRRLLFEEEPGGSKKISLIDTVDRKTLCTASSYQIVPTQEHSAAPDNFGWDVGPNGQLQRVDQVGDIAYELKLPDFAFGNLPILINHRRDAVYVHEMYNAPLAVYFGGALGKTSNQVDRMIPLNGALLPRPDTFPGNDRPIVYPADQDLRPDAIVAVSLDTEVLSGYLSFIDFNSHQQGGEYQLLSSIQDFGEYAQERDIGFGYPSYTDDPINDPRAGAFSAPLDSNAILYIRNVNRVIFHFISDERVYDKIRRMIPAARLLR